MNKLTRPQKSIRALMLVVSICALLALPAVAGAMVPPDDNLPAEAPPTVVHQERDGALLVAVAALAIALGATGYLAVRVRPVLRSARR